MAYLMMDGPSWKRVVLDMHPADQLLESTTHATYLDGLGKNSRCCASPAHPPIAKTEDGPSLAIG